MILKSIDVHYSNIKMEKDHVRATTKITAKVIMANTDEQLITLRPEVTKQIVDIIAKEVDHVIGNDKTGQG